MTAAETIADILRLHGVQRVFVFPGGTISYLLDRLVFKGIEVIVTRNEAAAGHMAQAAYRVSGNPQVFMVTSGPGCTNAVTPVADAFYDGDAVILLAGQVAMMDMRTSDAIRQRGFQETPTSAIMRPISKLAVCPKTAYELCAYINAAFDVATRGRPGPVIVEVPMNLLKQTADFIPRLADVVPGITADPEMIRRCKRAILDAARPLIVAGRGALGAVDALRAFADAMGINVVSSLPASGIMTGPLALGMLGHTGTREANEAIAQADLVIALGARLDIRQTGSDWGHWASKIVIKVDLDEGELQNGRIVADVACRCSVAAWLAAMA